ncbi:hypothetical protein CCACVL1_16455 [Corchorus capsularis]|uniref:Uncharacterized protein n=1 Tax=Corchorus capsularis TaxID=210143 RepID=A0A1R3HWZ5_COCAP|nr:hypothetical protein CCACVL1_16455 [Corchorus capsularis]
MCSREWRASWPIERKSEGQEWHPAKQKTEDRKRR